MKKAEPTPNRGVTMLALLPIPSALLNGNLAQLIRIVKPKEKPQRPPPF